MRGPARATTSLQPPADLGYSSFDCTSCTQYSTGLTRGMVLHRRSFTDHQLLDNPGARVPASIQRKSAVDREVRLRYSWPLTLRVPQGPRIVYLDLNHWISLAKALSGHPEGHRDRNTLEELLHAAQRDRAVFPLSLSIYVEILKIREHRRRSDLRKVIELLGGFAVVSNRHVIATHEIAALLDDLVGPNPNPISPVNYLDWGVLRVIGMGGLKVVTREGEDVTSAARQRYSDGPEEFDRIVREGMVKLNRDVIDGPTPQNEAEFRADGYRPDLILERYTEEAADEQAWARLLDGESRWRRGRLRDLVSAREVLFHINETLKTAANARGVHAFEDMLRNAENPRRAFDAMPSFDVAVTLKTAIHRNGQHRWTNNHIHDIHTLASTLPYCDVVLTDREMAAHVGRSKLDQRLGTSVLHNLDDLSALL